MIIHCTHCHLELDTSELELNVITKELIKSRNLGIYRVKGKEGVKVKQHYINCPSCGVEKTLFLESDESKKLNRDYTEVWKIILGFKKTSDEIAQAYDSMIELTFKIHKLQNDMREYFGLIN